MMEDLNLKFSTGFRSLWALILLYFFDFFKINSKAKYALNHILSLQFYWFDCISQPLFFFKPQFLSSHQHLVAVQCLKRSTQDDGSFSMMKSHKNANHKSDITGDINESESEYIDRTYSDNTYRCNTYSGNTYSNNTHSNNTYSQTRFENTASIEDDPRAVSNRIFNLVDTNNLQFQNQIFIARKLGLIEIKLASLGILSGPKLSNQIDRYRDVVNWFSHQDRDDLSDIWDVTKIWR